MIWFREKPQRPSAPTHTTPEARQAAAQISSCLDSADSLLTELQQKTRLMGKEWAETKLTLLEASLGPPKIYYETAIRHSDKAEKDTARTFFKASRRYVKYRIREGRRWLKQQP